MTVQVYSHPSVEDEERDWVKVSKEPEICEYRLFVPRRIHERIAGMMQYVREKIYPEGEMFIETFLQTFYRTGQYSVMSEYSDSLKRFNNTPVQCAECGVTMRRKNMRVHLNSHCKTVPVQCECGAEIYAQNIQNHYRRRKHITYVNTHGKNENESKDLKKVHVPLKPWICFPSVSETEACAIPPGYYPVFLSKETNLLCDEDFKDCPISE